MTIQRINAGRGHWYKVDGVKFDGVTTLIKGGLPNNGLMSWAARTVAEHVADNIDAVIGMRDMGRDSIVGALKGVPWTRSGEAAAKGTDVHGLAQRLTHGEEVDVPEHLAGYVESCIAFLDEWKVRPILTEAPVANRVWKYAGTLDLIADFEHPLDGPGVGIFDWKTSGSGIYPEAAYQMAAYRFAEAYLDVDKTEQPLPVVDFGFAVWLRPEAYDVIPVKCDQSVFDDFLYIARVARAAKSNRDLIGEAVHV
jgi:hypothetical protein